MSSRVRLPLSPLGVGRHFLRAEDAHYVSRVHRLGVGKTFVVFDPDQKQEADAVVVSISGDAVEIELTEPRAATNVMTRSILWMHALPKGDKADAIVQDATELGATQIQFVHSLRSIVRLDQTRAENRKTRWEKIAREAARQCGRGDIPTIRNVINVADALKETDANAERFFLYEEATEWLGTRLNAADKVNVPLIFVTGPEGGFDESEVEVARTLGFAVVSLGALVLRTETVCAAVLGAVRLLSAGMHV